MPKLTMTAFVSLDGVMQAPGAPTEDQSGGFTQGGWVVPFFDARFGEFMVGVFARAGAFLIGRRTYQIFAGHWPRVTDTSDPIAVALNKLPKYVASKSLDRVDWNGSTLIRDVPSEVARLKAAPGGGELQVHGSPGLTQTLLRHELVDELHLLLFPVILGGGKKLFGSGIAPTAFQLAATQATTTGVVISSYRRTGRPAYGVVHPP